MGYIEPQALYDYAARHADRAERSGRGTVWPTVRAAAKRFRCTQSDIITSVEDGAGNGVGNYFGISVGCQISGVGYGVHGSEGDWEIEAY